MKKIASRIAYGALIATAGLSTVLAQYNPVITPGGVNQSGQPLGAGLLNFIALLQRIVDLAVPFLIGLAVIAVFVGILKFLFTKESDEHAKWGKFLGMSILSLFVIVSIWGIVNFLGSVVGIGQGGEVRAPIVPRAQ